MQRIIVDGVSKKFKIGFKKKQGALARFVSVFSGREPKRIFWALRNVSLNAGAGECVGIIGKNGSGKSTLMRIIAGIYQKDKGKVKVIGKVISLIDLNIGMQERLTMGDNIYLCCSLFGLGRKAIRERFNSIVKFSELGDFVNTKLYQFSTGMRQRLAFSIAMYCNPEALLLDEVFEVGDEAFKKKSANKIKELVRKGAGVLLVSHDLSMIKRYCNRTIWMKNGKIFKIGKSDEISDSYKKMNN